MSALALFPRAMRYLLNHYYRTAHQSKPLSHLLLDYREHANVRVPEWYFAPPFEPTRLTLNSKAALSDKQIADHFELLKQQYSLVEYIRKTQNAHIKISENAEQELVNHFNRFLLHPRVLNTMFQKLDQTVELINGHERIILRLCTLFAQMPSKDFMLSFPGNETNLQWTHSVIKAGKSYSKRLPEYQDTIQTAQCKLLEIVNDNKISIVAIKELHRRARIGLTQLKTPAI